MAGLLSGIERKTCWQLAEQHELDRVRVPFGGLMPTSRGQRHHYSPRSRRVRALSMSDLPVSTAVSNPSKRRADPGDDLVQHFALDLAELTVPQPRRRQSTGPRNSIDRSSRLTTHAAG
ncbi:hypothetical protein [Yinghuangia aomiensis]|uniref:hypothetical protein n=1 Tax=Yinghuangia aomiensis TaxID=676205 RepID=UPI0031E516E8